jgi:hypothetical protein
MQCFSIRFTAIICIALSIPCSICAKDYIEAAGNVLEYALPVSAGCVALCKSDLNGVIQLGESVFLNEVVTFSLKYTVREKRPDGEDFHSFPSGHTSISVASSEFLRKRYGWQYGVPAYSLAAFTGYSRIESRRHFFHDVLAGAAIGFVSSYIFTRKYPDKNLFFQISDNGIAITVDGTF